MATLTGEEQGMGIVSWSKESNVPFLSSVVLNEKKDEALPLFTGAVLCVSFSALSVL